jgi:hypothetical protein
MRCRTMVVVLDFSTMPLHRRWPMSEARESTCRPSPSRAMAKIAAVLDPKVAVEAPLEVPPAPVPDLRQLDQLLAVRYDHEIPRLPVSREWCSPSRLKDALKVFAGDRLAGILA